VLHQIMKEKEDKRLLCITTLWFLWSERNTIREDGRRRTAESIARNIQAYVGEMRQAPLDAQSSSARQTQHWEKPSPGVLKLNCDGSFIPGEKCGGWGFLIRDSDGDVVITGRGRVNHLLNAFQAEIIACIHGVQTTINLGMGHLILETDAMMVKQAMLSEKYSLAMVRGLVEELKWLTATNFISFDCVHVSRTCNKAAHMLAALGVGGAEGEDHVSCNIPDSVDVFVADDLSSHGQ
jgi:ribonuclease HI